MNAAYISELAKQCEAETVVVLANSGSLELHGPDFDSVPTGLEIYDIVKRTGEPLFIYCIDPPIADICAD